MDNKDILLEIRQDIKDIKTEIITIKVLDAHQNASLDAHMARTKVVEEGLKEQRDFKWYFTGLSILFIGFLEFLRRIGN